MIRVLVLSLVFFCFATVAFSQSKTDKAINNCAAGKKDAEVVECLEDVIVESLKEINSVISSAEDLKNTYPDDEDISNYVDRLKESHKAWEVYTQNYCLDMCPYGSACPESVAEMQTYMCLLYKSKQYYDDISEQVRRAKNVAQSLNKQ